MERRRLITWASTILATLVFGLGAPLALCGPETCSMMQSSQATAAHSCCEQPETVQGNCCSTMGSCDLAPAPLPTVAQLGLPAIASSATVAIPLAEDAPSRPETATSEPTGSPPPLFTLHSSLLI